VHRLEITGCFNSCPLCIYSSSGGNFFGKHGGGIFRNHIQAANFLTGAKMGRRQIFQLDQAAELTFTANRHMLTGIFNVTTSRIYPTSYFKMLS